MIEYSNFIEKSKEAFKDFIFLNPKDIFQLSSVIKLEQIKKAEHLVKEGEFNYKAFKVLKGLLSHYVIDKNGDEKTLLFVPEGRFSGSLQTIFKNMPADENIVALENSLILSCDIRKLEKLASDNIRILKILSQSHKEIILDAAKRIKFLIAHNEEERYFDFAKSYPNLEQRIRQKDLASFLGITVSSLSRIRSRIMKR